MYIFPMLRAGGSRQSAGKAKEKGALDYIATTWRVYLFVYVFVCLIDYLFVCLFVCVFCMCFDNCLFLELMACGTDIFRFGVGNFNMWFNYSIYIGSHSSVRPRL